MKIIGLLIIIVIAFVIVKLINIQIIDFVLLIFISIGIGLLTTQLFFIIFLKSRKDLNSIKLGIFFFVTSIFLNFSGNYMLQNYKSGFLIFWLYLFGNLGFIGGIIFIIFGIIQIFKGTNIDRKNLNEHANEKLRKFSIKLDKKIPRDERKKQLEQFRDELLKDKKNIDPKL